MKFLSFSLVILAAMAFSSCQKEISYEVDPGNTGGSGGSSGGSGGSSSGYYIKGKKDGTAFSYSGITMGVIMDLAGYQSVSLVANSSSNGSSLEGLNLSITFNNTTSKLTTKTYSEDDTSMEYIAAGVYNPNSSTITWAAGLTANTVKPLKITITAKSNTEVSGTFEGAFYKEDLVAGTISQTENILFTDGSFKLPIK